MRSPLVSIITRTKNRPKFVQEALESVIAQEYKNWEVMLINDAGEDIASLVNQFKEKKKIKYLFTKENLGRCAAGNWGLREAQGKYISYLDDDDIYYPNHLSTLVEHLEKGEFKVAYTDAYRALQRKTPNGYEIVDRALLLSYEFSVVRFMKEVYIHLVTFMHHRECTERMGYFDESLQVLEDLDLYFRFSQFYKFSHIPVITAEYRIRDDNTNAVTALQKEFIETKQMLHKKYFNLVIPRLLMHFQDQHERLTGIEQEVADLRKMLEQISKRLPSE